MTVIFATYQSIQVIADAQTAHGVPEFDLIICDEAHRTTGATLAGEDESNFVKVHSNDVIKGRKRLYMTATPRIFGENVKTRAEEADAVLASMDDEALYGKTLYYRGFSWAVQNNLLTDYKVVVLAMDEGLVSAAVQRRLADSSSELVLDDATKIVGCYKALTKADMKVDLSGDPLPMRRALAFCNDIATSKLVRNEFSAVVEEFLSEEHADGKPDTEAELRCEVEHVDGTFNAKRRGALLDWLKADAGERVCRILTNARCLSEGVDVPALDAIMFLHPRKSQIDVAVGRARDAKGGRQEDGLRDPPGRRSARNPARAGTEQQREVQGGLADPECPSRPRRPLRCDHQQGVARAGRERPDRDHRRHEQGARSRNGRGRRPARSARGPAPENREAGQGARHGRARAARDGLHRRRVLPGDHGQDRQEVRYPRLLEDWATNIAKIAKNHISRLTGILKAPDTTARCAFDGFLEELRDDLNDTITKADAIEMLAQHIITRPVFQVLFEGHQFTDENPVSRAMQGVLDVLDEENLEKESKDLEKFYASVQMRAHGITDPQAKQRLVVELYDKFFRNAFPRTTEKLGIVYTPVEIVDFIIRSVNEVLQEEFGQSLGSEGVHIIDPFAGTGTFITRLLQSGLIAPEELERKYREEIHANEIVLLAYYIAAINIEAVYHGIVGEDYVPFEGICLTDTFQMYESDDLIAEFMLDNSERRKRQKEQQIKVIIGNPPYSAGQRSQNDDAANVAYPSLDARIRESYAADSRATLSRNLYDPYIRAIRWGSDQLEDAGGGIMAYVTNAGWLDANAMDGMRKCLTEEFGEIFVFHLRATSERAGNSPVARVGRYLARVAVLPLRSPSL